MKKLFIPILLLFLGCAELVGDYSDVYRDGLPDEIQPVLDYNETGGCEESKCTVMLCNVERSQSYLCQLGFLKRWWDVNCPYASLEGSKCYFVRDFNETDWENITKDHPEIEIREFMIGQGATFWEFEEANQYCNNKLRMSVKWLVGNSNVNYSSPDVDRAECFLQRGIMPVYILYSNGTNINPERAGQIAQTLRDVGPVVITTEMGFDSSNATVVSLVQEQIRQIRDNCPEDQCLIALAPKMGDELGVARVFSDTTILDKTDLIAYGIDTRESKTRCDVKWLFMKEVSPFSKKMVRTYQKPSIIPYAIFDVAPNGLGDCDWEEEQVDEAYDYFFRGIAGTIVNSGIIGFAPYELYPDTGPIECNDCSITTYDSQNLEANNDSARFRSWFAYCQKYMGIPAEVSGSRIAFPNASGGGACNFIAGQPKNYLNLMYGGLDLSATPETPELQPKRKTDYKCGSCIVESKEDLDAFNLPDWGGTVEPETCTAFEDDIALYAEKNDVDKMLVRAYISLETFYTDLQGKGGECSVNFDSFSGVYPPEYEEDVISYPRRICGYGASSLPENTLQQKREKYRKWAVPYMEDPSGTCSRWPKSLDYDYCALGLMQVIEVPYIYWDENMPTDDPSWAERAERTTMQLPGRPYVERELAKGCSEEFNPFNTTHVVCMGTAKLRGLMDSARTVVYSRADDLDIVESNGEVNKTKAKILEAYIAAWMYNGRWFNPVNPGSSWITKFAEQKEIDAGICESGDPTAMPSCCLQDSLEYTSRGLESTVKTKSGECCGRQDFIDYVYHCESWLFDNDHASGGFDYGAIILGKYKEYLDECYDYSYCPPRDKWEDAQKEAYQEASEND